jgi:hypothetical protein
MRCSVKKAKPLFYAFETRLTALDPVEGLGLFACCQHLDQDFGSDLGQELEQDLDPSEALIFA